MNTIGERLAKAMLEKRFSSNKLAVQTGVHPSTIKNYIINKGTPDLIKLEKVAEILDINFEWLKDGIGEAISNVRGKDVTVIDPFEVIYLENNNSNSFIKLENGQYLMTMPLAEYNIQAGFLDIYQDIEKLKGLNQHSIIVDKPAKGRYIAFRVKGDSMDDGTSNAIQQNSIVSTRELQRHLWTDKIRFKDFQYWVIYTTQSKYPLLKEIINHDVETGVIRCHSLNDGPDYSDFDLSLNDVQALFYVVDVNKQLSKKLIY